MGGGCINDTNLKFKNLTLEQCLPCPVPCPAIPSFLAAQPSNYGDWRLTCCSAPYLLDVLWTLLCDLVQPKIPGNKKPNFRKYGPRKKCSVNMNMKTYRIEFLKLTWKLHRSYKFTKCHFLCLRSEGDVGKLIGQLILTIPLRFKLRM